MKTLVAGASLFMIGQQAVVAETIVPVAETALIRNRVSNALPLVGIGLGVDRLGPAQPTSDLRSATLAEDRLAWQRFVQECGFGNPTRRRKAALHL
jgi:hypothetical protein